MNQNIYSIGQLEEYLSTLPIGTDSVQKISEFCHIQEKRMDYIRKRASTAARLLGDDLITECMEDE